MGVFMKKLFLILSTVSSTMFAMESGDKSGKNCCELYTHEEIVNLQSSFFRKLKPLTLLALTCHEFPDEDVRLKAEKILQKDPQAPFKGFVEKDEKTRAWNSDRNSILGINSALRQGEYLRSPLQLIEEKQKRGCDSSACEQLRRMIVSAEQQLKANAQVKASTTKEIIEQHYEELKKNL
jgi:hypothetical protein